PRRAARPLRPRDDLLAPRPRRRDRGAALGDGRPLLARRVDPRRRRARTGAAGGGVRRTPRGDDMPADHRGGFAGSPTGGRSMRGHRTRSGPRGVNTIATATANAIAGAVP